MTRSQLCLMMAAGAALALAAGCASYPVKFGLLHGGHIDREHGKPMEGGYYQDFDPDADSLEVTPVESTNPVQTQHVLIATVRDAEGNPLPCRRVEWILSEGGVGQIVEVDESGWYDTRGYKVDNTYAVTHTNQGEHVLTRGNDDPSDDIHLEKGQTWCVITSPIEGDTNVTVYAPAIFNWDKHKVFAVKHWQDAAWQWPPAATNPVGTPHEMQVKVMRASNGQPLEGWIVHFELVDGPAGHFTPGRKPMVEVKTDANGVATATLHQADPAEGTNTIRMTVIRPANEKCCIPEVKIAEGMTTKTWVGPRIGITKTGPARAGVGDTFEYTIVASNPGQADATNVVVTDTVPDGLKVVSTQPKAQASGQALTWRVGTIGAMKQTSMTVRVQATRSGTFENCAEVTADHGLKARDCATTVVTQPALELTKTGPAEVLQCDPITYTVTVRNAGDGTAENVKITDKLPNGLETDSGLKTVVVNVGDLGPGKAMKATYTVKAAKTGTFTNTAVASGEPNLSAEATHKVTVTNPVLQVEKTGPEMRYLGTRAEFTITVSNTGDGPARNTTLTDTVPAGLEFVSASSGGQMNGGQIVWNLGTLNPDQTKTVTATFMARQPGDFSNTATANAYCTTAADDASIRIEGIAAILLEVVDEADPIEVGANETYTITVTNQGSAVDTNIQIVCTLPAEQDYVSSTGPTQARAQGKTVTFAPLPALAPKAQAVFRVVVKANATGDVRFRTEMTSDQLTSPVMETESTHVYE